MQGCHLWIQCGEKVQGELPGATKWCKWVGEITDLKHNFAAGHARRNLLVAMQGNKNPPAKYIFKRALHFQEQRIRLLKKDAPKGTFPNLPAVDSATVIFVK